MYRWLWLIPWLLLQLNTVLCQGVPFLRTRSLDSLNNREISEYLQRNDIIVIPVGTVELHGEMPVGCEHVLPLAFARRIAEEADALVLPGMIYFYPGATAIAQGLAKKRRFLPCSGFRAPR